MKRTETLTVVISDELVETLNYLAERNGRTVTEELKRSIVDRKYFIDKTDQGNKIFLVPTEPSGQITQVVMN